MGYTANPGAGMSDSAARTHYASTGKHDVSDSSGNQSERYTTSITTGNAGRSTTSQYPIGTIRYPPQGTGIVPDTNAVIPANFKWPGFTEVVSRRIGTDGRAYTEGWTQSTGQRTPFKYTLPAGWQWDGTKSDVRGSNGSHGGCSSCIMTKVHLVSRDVVAQEPTATESAIMGILPGGVDMDVTKRQMIVALAVLAVLAVVGYTVKNRDQILSKLRR